MASITRSGDRGSALLISEQIERGLARGGASTVIDLAAVASTGQRPRSRTWREDRAPTVLAVRNGALLRKAAERLWRAALSALGGAL
jgi:hypothetical protein